MNTYIGLGILVPLFIFFVPQGGGQTNPHLSWLSFGAYGIVALWFASAIVLGGARISRRFPVRQNATDEADEEDEVDVDELEELEPVEEEPKQAVSMHTPLPLEVVRTATPVSAAVSVQETVTIPVRNIEIVTIPTSEPIPAYVPPPVSVPVDNDAELGTLARANKLPWPLTGFKQDQPTALQTFSKIKPKHPSMLLGVTKWDPDHNWIPDKLRFVYAPFVAGAPCSILVAGSSGTGKSAMLQGALGSLCYLYGPNEVQLILLEIEKDGADYAFLRGLPHMKAMLTSRTDFGNADSVRNSRMQVARFMMAIQRERDVRAKLFQKAAVTYDTQVGSIAEYNRLVKPAERLPLLIPVIDEARTFGQVQGPAKRPVGRPRKDEDEDSDYTPPTPGEQLEQLARAGRSDGISLVLATQYPTSDVLSRLTTTQIPNRVAMKLVDSTQTQVVFGAAPRFKPHELPAIDVETSRNSGRFVYRQGSAERDALVQALYYSGSDLMRLRETIAARWLETVPENNLFA